MSGCSCVYERLHKESWLKKKKLSSILTVVATRVYISDRTTRTVHTSTHTTYTLVQVKLVKS